MWYEKYLNIPFKHLGNNIEEGIDCFFLVKYVYLQELKIDIPYSSSDFCKNKDQNWYNQINNDPFRNSNNTDLGWERVSELREFDVVTLSIGSTNCTNHCAIYTKDNKILHILEGKKSIVSSYGNFYRNYTVGKYRWIGKVNLTNS